MATSSYSAKTRPMGPVSGPIDVSTIMSFNGMNNIDQMNGFLNVNIFLDIFWSDYFLKWNSSLTDGITHVYIPSQDM